jgi:hypothetical protein
MFNPVPPPELRKTGAWQPGKLVLVTAVGRAGPVWRHAFVRFTENRVIRTSFLSGSSRAQERAGEAVTDFQCSVLSETAGTGLPALGFPV